MFSDYAKDYIKYAKDIQKKRSWKRDVSSLRNLTEVFGDNRLSKITTKDIMLYREKKLLKGKERSTNKLELSCLSRLFKVAK